MRFLLNISALIILMVLFCHHVTSMTVIPPLSSPDKRDLIKTSPETSPSRAVAAFKQTKLLLKPFENPELNRYIELSDSLYNLYKSDQALEYLKKAEASANKMNLEDKVKLYFRISSSCHDLLDFKTTLRYLMMTHQYCEAGEMEEELAWVRLKIGNIYRIQNFYNEAIRYCFLAVEYFQEKNQRHNLAKAFNSLGEIHSSTGNSSLAIKYFNKAYALCGDTLTSFFIYLTGNLIDELLATRNNKEVAKHIKKIQNLSVDCKNPDLLRETYFLLSDPQLNFQGGEETSLQLLQKALAVTDTMNQAYPYGVLLLNIGSRYIQISQLREAEKYLNNSFRVLSKCGNRYIMASLYKQLSILAQKKGNIPLTIHYLQQAEKSSTGLNLLSQILLINQQLAGIYESQGDYRQADEYLNKVIFLQDSLYRVNLSERITSMQLNHQMIEDQKEKDFLKKTNQLEADKRKNLWFLLITVIMAALATTSTLYVLYRIKKKNNRILAEQGEKLRLLNATKDKFFSIIAHDLKNPFNTLMGLSEILVEDYRSLPPEDVKSYLKVINQASVQGNELLENLLQWSRTQAGRIAYNPTRTDLDQLVTETVSLLHSIAFSKNITVTFEPGSIGDIQADHEMLSTIIRNLVSNALKFTYRGGSVVIKTQRTEREVILSVQDNGTGMSPEKLEKLFRIESQVSTRGTEKEKGTGLGLILCKEFITSHKGRIEVISEEGKGTEFKVFLPEERKNE